MISRIYHKIKKEIKGISNEQLSLDANIKAGLKVGDNCYGLISCTIDHGHAWLIEIGNNVIFAPQVYLLAHDTSTKRFVNHTRIAKTKIGDNCFIGARVLIMPGVSIGKNSIIGAGSVVTKSIPENVVAAGNPAKVLSSIEDYKMKVVKDFDLSPKYSEEYTIRANVSNDKKDIMINEIKKNGYVK